MSLSGDRIRELRIQHDMTLDDVAKYLGINRQAVYKYEQGIVTNIPLDKIEKMATLFGTTPDYIAGWTEDQPQPVSYPIATDEARIISGGIDKLPKEQRERALNMFRIMFEPQYADLFTKENEEDDT